MTPKPTTAVCAPGADPAYDDGKLVLQLTVIRHKGGTWEVAATRADGSTARHRGMAEYDNAFFAVEDELDALHDTYLAQEDTRSMFRQAHALALAAREETT